jgi:sugar phosphate isomerase/epimerase
MAMDWEAIARALRDIKYGGYITLEANAYLGAYTKENAELGVRRLDESAKRLASMVGGESV